MQQSPFRRSGRGTSGLGQIIAVCPFDAFDRAEVQQPAQLPREPVRREHFQFGKKVGAADPGDVDLWILQGMQQRCCRPVRRS
jgi:hypothetical protein